jgi:hypothetical protein
MFDFQTAGRDAFIRASWFETALKRLLTMRVRLSRHLLQPHPEEAQSAVSKDGPQ